MPISENRSRTSTYTSEAHERITRAIKTHSNKLKRQIEKFNSFSDFTQGVEFTLDALRLLALFSGCLTEVSEMSTLEYLSLCEVVRDECLLFSGFFVNFLKKEDNPVRRLNWYRVVKSAEIALPRSILILTIGNSYLQMNDDFLQETIFNSSKGIKTKKDLFLDIQASFVCVSDPLKGLILNSILMDVLIVPRIHLSSNDSGLKLSLKESINCLLENFSFVNRLWVRLRYYSPDEVDDIRRKQLQGIVSSSLYYMAKLEGLDCSIYSYDILPIIIQHLIGCQDDLAQEYLTITLLEEFPIPFHSLTIEQLLDAISQFNPTVDIRQLISAVINCILNMEVSSPLEEAKLFDSLWSRVSDLLLNRLETSRSGEAILLCTSFLHHSLSLKQYDADRVEKILSFICKAAHRDSVYNSNPEENISLLTSKIIDLLVEFVPNAGTFYHLPSLQALLEELNPKSSSSCALSIIGRLVKDNSSVVDSSQMKTLISIIRFIWNEYQDDGDNNANPVNLEYISDHVDIFEFVSGSTFNALILEDHFFEFTTLLIDFAMEIEHPLGLLVTLKFAINSLLVNKVSSLDIKGTLSKSRKFLSGKQILPVVSFSQFDAFPVEKQSKLTYHLHDSVASVLISLWGRCLDFWTEDLIYDAIAECILILEEEVTNDRVQSQIIIQINNFLKDKSDQLRSVDLSVFIQKLILHSKRILKLEDRRKTMFCILEMVTLTSNQVDPSIVVSVADSISKMLPKELENELDLELFLNFCQEIIHFMQKSALDPILGSKVYDRLIKIQTFVMGIDDDPDIKEKVSTLLDEWSKLEPFLRPNYSTEAIQESETLEINPEHINSAISFATFSPDFE